MEAPDIAPLISEAKAAQAWRRFLSTVLGGGRMLPGMPLKIYLFQALVWLLPVLGSASIAFLGSDTWHRFSLGAAASLLTSTCLELLRSVLSRTTEPGIKAAWFVDDEELDFSGLSPQVMRQLIPRRSWLCWVGACMVSAFLCATCAAVLAPISLAESLDETSAPVVACWVFLTAGVAHFGLYASPPPEVSGSDDAFSRPLLVLLMLAPLLLQPPIALAQGLVVAVSLLPLCWALGLLPSLPELLLWALEQAELLLGGSWPPRLLLSLALALGAAAGCSQLAQPASAVAGLGAAAALVLLPELSFSSGFASSACELLPQVLVAALVAVPICHFEPLSSAELLVLRVSLEQGALLLTLLARILGRCRAVSPLEGSAKQCRVPVSNLLEETLARNCPSIGRPCADRRGTVVRTALLAAARILMLVDLAVAFPTRDAGDVAPYDLGHAVLCLLQLRALRVAMVQTPRAALDMALAALQLLSADAWPMGVAIFAVSVARQRAGLLVASIGYVAHLCRITLATPKLRHPVTKMLVAVDVLLWPGLLLVLLLSAVLESPVISVFSLPLFTLSPPRPHSASEPFTKGAEGLFYEILGPSLLRALRGPWRQGLLSAQPGALFFCRSHERLACVLRVVARGFGCVQLELRGLELQEPTSCHHVEAGKIDEAFAAAFDGRPAARPFVLRPVCEVLAEGYEQTVVSLRGLLDHPEVLQKVHRLFLKSLVFMVLRQRAVPEGWLGCPVRQQDLQQVVQLLKSFSWPPEVADALAPRDLRTTAQEDTSSNVSSPRQAWQLPQPPPGSPPLIRPPSERRKVSKHLMAWSGSEEDTQAEEEDLDALMDQVMGMAPKISGAKSSTGARKAARRLLEIQGDEPEKQAQESLSSLPLGAFRAESQDGASPRLEKRKHPAKESKDTRAWNEEGPVLRLVAQAYIAANVVPAFGQAPETLGISHVLRLFTGTADRKEPEVVWLADRPEYLELAARAFRAALKICLDSVAMGEEDDVEYEVFAERVVDLDAWFLGVEGSSDWEAAMRERSPNLMALRSKGLEVQLLRLRLVEDAVRVAELRPEVWQSIWASSCLELRYLGNDDEERYSIQAHPTLLRNMAVQCAEYPIYVSPPSTLWL